jgi:hypothetical protein
MLLRAGTHKLSRNGDLGSSCPAVSTAISGGSARRICDDPDLTLHAVLVDVSDLYAKSITSGRRHPRPIFFLDRINLHLNPQPLEVVAALLAPVHAEEET